MVNDRYGEANLKRIQMFVYLVPIVGFFPALWTLYRKNGSREQRQVSQLAVKLALGWLAGNLLLQVGIQTHQGAIVPLLILASLLTSGYFLTNLWLMIRLWQRQSLDLFKK
ncbi:hypothetical protein [Leptolyngbya ohadii]|uniref:hypothetical protein n=1 Tax=Leptolyngbya ohadii TaxID=1962290 RepID=UPI000B59AC8C|nr:hypothetical protein [Leptolyngbya ohadii]